MRYGGAAARRNGDGLALFGSSRGEPWHRAPPWLSPYDDQNPLAANSSVPGPRGVPLPTDKEVVLKVIPVLGRSVRSDSAPKAIACALFMDRLPCRCCRKNARSQLGELT
jgi:hypothetical protein